MTKLTLNLGCGERIYPRYPNAGYKCINVDMRRLPNVHTICDVVHLPFLANTFDYVLASDIIEHFPIAKTTSVLEEWKRILKPEGAIEFRLPNLEAIVEDYLKRRQEDRSDMKGMPIAHYFSWLLYGGQDYPGNFHYVGFDRRFFASICAQAGLKEVNWKKDGYNMIVIMEKNHA